MQEIKKEMESGSSYSNIFFWNFRTDEYSTWHSICWRSFSQMKMIKTRQWNRLTDVTLAQLMRIAIEGSDHTSVNFEEIFVGFNSK